MKLMNGFRYLVGLSMALTLCSPPVWATQATATATVSVAIPTVALLSLLRDNTISVTRGSPTQIIFDQLDTQQPPPGAPTTGPGAPDPNFMYAPYRNEVGHWHIAHATANGTSIVFSMSVTGTVGTQTLASRLNTFCGGFYEIIPGSTTSPLVTGTPSTAWQPVQGFQRTLDGHQDTKGYFSYQLDVSGIPAGTYPGGVITYTLVST